ncbi:ecotin family protein [Acinetobacter guillouiae]|uniref:ecotin family protein n=1 Tax=Acinetobacter guillouiae TaxID=106649 RepID=UPI0021D2C201|nr:ecotin family protein [Acinetobacter guillouiae]MCU4493887.1 ecotin family protein [Acinetobacter guillouiae]
MKKVLILCLFSISVNAYANKSANDLNVYPEVKKDQNRNVILLDPKENEEDYRVLITASMEGMQDCNTKSRSAKYTKKLVEGMQYPYYEVGKLGNIITTLMGCSEMPKMGEIPINLNGNTILNYNSKLPIVVYASNGIKISSKIFKLEEIKKSKILND